MWIKRGLIKKFENVTDWWQSHGMAPAAFLYDDCTIRILQGCWDSNGISRIGFVDVDSKNPSIIKNISKVPVLDIGNDGCFDDNGVFPGHVYKMGNEVYLYYTGFQKLDKIPFSNFSGLAISYDGGDTFQRVSQAPVLDRADEGLFTRAGLSVIKEDGVFKCCYSTGGSWAHIAGKNRPIYEVSYIESKNGIDFDKKGRCVVPVNLEVEHGLGRPQLTKIDGVYYVFYTRRMLDYKYHMGVAKTLDLMTWERCDEWLSTVDFGEVGTFDSDMIYFPCVIDTGIQIFLFYSGNGYGREGLGFAELRK